MTIIERYRIIDIPEPTVKLLDQIPILNLPIRAENQKEVVNSFYLRQILPYDIRRQVKVVNSISRSLLVKFWSIFKSRMKVVTVNYTVVAVII